MTLPVAISIVVIIVDVDLELELSPVIGECDAVEVLEILMEAREIGEVVNDL